MDCKKECCGWPDGGFSQESEPRKTCQSTNLDKETFIVVAAHAFSIAPRPNCGARTKAIWWIESPWIAVIRVRFFLAHALTCTKRTLVICKRNEFREVFLLDLMGVGGGSWFPIRTEFFSIFEELEVNWLDHFWLSLLSSCSACSRIRIWISFGRWI